MVLPWVSRGRYEELRDRVEWQQALIASLLADVRRVAAPPQRITSDMLTPETRVQPIRSEDLDAPLPPPIYDAIRSRVPAGSPQAAELARQAREGMERMGRDFDAEAFAENIRVGTRVKGFPL